MLEDNALDHAGVAVESGKHGYQRTYDDRSSHVPSIIATPLRNSR
jgi:hypothetical protein